MESNRKRKLTWFGLIVAAVLVTSGHMIPIGITTISERSAVGRTRAESVVKRCPQESQEGPKGAKGAGAQAQSDRWYNLVLRLL